MRLSELQAKDIIALKDGKRVGRIIDADVNINTGTINYLVIEPRRFMKNLMIGNKETTISFVQINTVGEDVILVDLK